VCGNGIGTCAVDSKSNKWFLRIVGECGYDSWIDSSAFVDGLDASNNSVMPRIDSSAFVERLDASYRFFQCLGLIRD
jgi:hypothetical protein